MFFYIWGRMIYEKYLESLQNDELPQGIEDVLSALWWDGKGDWDKAHRIAQNISDWRGSWVHAYIHRKEGDTGNADYWYARAGKSRHQGSLDEEWSELVKYFCNV